jgi:hypothetical protein
MAQPTTPAQIRAEYPLLADNEGVWEGTYRYYDAATGKLTDRFPGLVRKRPHLVG